jgi:BirA family biotin operon repressor/biotin-[acetyl-CoA-carboxylase] ligase
MVDTAPCDTLLQHLADGRFHSGEALSRALGVSRTAVWKQVQRLQRDYQVAVHAVRGRGYRLAAPLELLDAERIRSQLGDAGRRRLQAIRVMPRAASTNASAAASPPQHFDVGEAWLAEFQTSGRGRRGRNWIGAFGHGIAMSLAWRFQMPMSRVSALSLVAGVAVAQAIDRLGISGHGLKWPNDLVADGRKLAGILVEVSGEAEGPATAIIGIGLNVNMPEHAGRRIDQPWIDLGELAAGPVSRNRLAALLLDALLDACARFSEAGMTPFLELWSRYDSLVGEPVSLTSGERAIHGTYLGVAGDGAVILQTPGGRQHYHAGEVSLRRADAP